MVDFNTSSRALTGAVFLFAKVPARKSSIKSPSTVTPVTLSVPSSLQTYNSQTGGYYDSHARISGVTGKSARFR